MTKAISAVIATIMLFMITVSLIGVFYVFSSTMATQSTSSGSAQASQLAAQLSMCMQVDNIVGNQIILRNCGKGVIENKSLVVTMDDIALSANTQTILEGNSSVVNISGLWQVPFGKHSLKISNGAAVAQSLVEIIPNPDGLAGSWNFDEGSGNKAYDNSGNGNAGTLTNMNTSGNATSGWAAGRFGSGLRFDGVNDYATIPASTSLTNKAFSVSGWVNVNSVPSTSSHFMRRSVDWYFRIDNDRTLRGYVWGTGAGVSQTSNTFTFGTYYFITMTYDDAADRKIHIFINGNETTYNQQTATTGMMTNSNSATFIGSDDSSGLLFNGTIDEVRIWNKAFSPDETVAMKRII